MNGGNRIREVACKRQDARNIGSTSLINWKTAPALDTAITEVAKISHANAGGGCSATLQPHPNSASKSSSFGPIIPAFLNNR